MTSTSPRLWLIGSLIAVTLVSCGKAADSDSTKRRGDQPFPVEVAVVATQDLAQSLRAPGTVEAFEVVQITARVAGSLDRLLVAEGDHVAVGDQIAVIDAARYRLALTTAQAQVARAEAGRDDARAAAARREELAKDNRIQQEEVQQARLRVLQAEADVAVAAASLERATLDLKDATVTAPIAAMIQQRDARTGAYLSIGAPLVTVIQRDPLALRFSVPVADARHLAIGQPVTVTVGGNTATAVIRLIADLVEPSTRLVPVIARFQPLQADPQTANLRPGMFVEVAITLPTRTAIAVPSLALRSSERGTMAYIVEGKVLRERKVTLDGQTDHGDAIVTSGLAVGDVLAVRAADGLRDGMTVTVATRADDVSSSTAHPPASPLSSPISSPK